MLGLLSHLNWIVSERIAANCNCPHIAIFSYCWHCPPGMVDLYLLSTTSRSRFVASRVAGLRSIRLSIIVAAGGAMSARCDSIRRVVFVYSIIDRIAACNTKDVPPASIWVDVRNNRCHAVYGSKTPRLVLPTYVGTKFYGLASTINDNPYDLPNLACYGVELGSDGSWLSAVAKKGVCNRWDSGELPD